MDEITSCSIQTVSDHSTVKVNQPLATTELKGCVKYLMITLEATVSS